MCDHDHEHDHAEPVSRRTAVKSFFYYAAVGAFTALAAAVPLRKAQAGYGRCSKCNCPGYEGNQNLCGNCGHQYADHW